MLLTALCTSCIGNPLILDTSCCVLSRNLYGIDASILRLARNDSTLSLDDIASAVGASKTPAWDPLKRFKAEGFVRREVAIDIPVKTITVLKSMGTDSDCLILRTN